MIILASASPRRAELLRAIGVEFTVKTAAVAEISVGAPEEVAAANARAKAEHIAALCPDTPVLAADTVVALGDRIFGKPQDEADAANMLQALSGRTHRVITGVALAKGGEIFVRTDTTTVEFDDISPREIKNYVADGEPMDKAGAYAIQGRAMGWIKRIDGSYANVVGLPVHLVRQMAWAANIALCPEDDKPC